MIELGDPIPEERSGKINILLNLINEYSEIFRNILQGKMVKRKNFLKGEGRFKIRKLYENLLLNYTKGFNPKGEYDNSYIEEIIDRQQGHSIPGFQSFDAFYELLQPQFEKLKNPIDEAYIKTFNYLTFLSRKILKKFLKNFQMN